MKVKESFYSNGNIFMQETFDSTNNIEHIKYFSKNGEVIKKLKYKNGKLKKSILDRIIKKPKIVEIVELRELLRRADVNMTDKEINELEDFIIRQHKKNSQQLS